MEVSINAETAAKIKALERIGRFLETRRRNARGIYWRIWTLRAS